MPDLSDDNINRSDMKEWTTPCTTTHKTSQVGDVPLTLQHFMKKTVWRTQNKSSTPKTQEQQTTDPSTSVEASNSAAKPTHKKRTPPSTSHKNPKVPEVI